jgi:hypothetical protein
MLLLLIGAVIGYIAWSGHIYGLVTAPLLALLWVNAKNKLHAYLIILAYYLTSSHGLIKGAGVFFSNVFAGQTAMLTGLSIWFVPCAILALPWGLLWNKQGFW